MFLGYCFAADSTSSNPTVAPSKDIEKLTIKNSKFIEVYVTTKLITVFDGVFPENWTFDTRLHSLFKNDLYGGNVDFTESIVEQIRIKKKTKNDTRWQTIFEKNINDNEDFKIEFIDYYEPVGDIQYAYVAVISGGESDYITNTVKSEFDSYFCVEKNVSYPFILNVKTSETLNYEAQSVKPINRKYPITIVNGNTGYKSGSIDCTFLQVCDQSNLSPLEYRQRIYNMLTDFSPKIIKSFEGEFYMVNIEGNIEDSDRQIVSNGENLFTLVTTKFNWVECANAYEAKELYNDGFIDVSTL